MSSESRRLTRSWDALADWGPAGQQRRQQQEQLEPQTSPTVITAIPTVQPQLRQLERAKHSIRRSGSCTDQQQQQQQQQQSAGLNQSQGSADLGGPLGTPRRISAVDETRTPRLRLPSSTSEQSLLPPRAPGLSPRILSIEDSLSASASGRIGSNQLASG